MGNLPYVSSNTSQGPDQTLDILIEGKALSEVNHAQVHTGGTNWFSINLSEAPVLANSPPERSLTRSSLMDWITSRWKDGDAEPLLRGRGVVPMAVAAQVSFGSQSEKLFDTLSLSHHYKMYDMSLVADSLERASSLGKCVLHKR